MIISDNSDEFEKHSRHSEDIPGATKEESNGRGSLMCANPKPEIVQYFLHVVSQSFLPDYTVLSDRNCSHLIPILDSKYALRHSEAPNLFLM